MFAHRGTHRGPQDENTLTSFKKAIKKGIGFECDVRMSKDNVPVIIHDKTLLRTHGIKKKVSDFTHKELTHYNIPTVKYILSNFSNDVKIIFDLKEENCIKPMSILCKNKKNVIFLLWSDNWDPPDNIPSFRAYGCTFPETTHLTGISCKFSGSTRNITCINNALKNGHVVNLYSPDLKSQKYMMSLFKNCTLCTFTV